MTVILLRHGVSTSNLSHTLAGRAPGVELAERGREQALVIADRLSQLPIDAVVRSPLLRCEQTVAPLAEKLGLTPVVEDRLAEVDYGEWTGQAIKDLLKEPLWKVVQRHASGAFFPGGEGLAEVQIRAVAAIRQHEARLVAQHDRDVLWIACTHGDVIKSILADALGIHLDGFQRIVAEPASISVVRYSATSPYVWRFNDTGADLSALANFAKPRAADTTGTASEPIPGGEVSNVEVGDNKNQAFDGGSGTQ
ncbi:histidine phosphatase family protein [Antrihabitans sp. YC2-6]|uniref:histidine phosphatase family protein n=1 Tax=Antrihabitans sp. YC2-6 TaxID=2799498 RepID=UPI0018F36A59|nr:histidine phosphatase family protein [Antrihabitans sp. YC2-6]MBJ8345630.1 MSMEG_4193 family putative phosphomutase [Antrihabitans sp. YC2-6]